MQDVMAALDVYEESKAHSEELLKVLGLHPVKNVLWIVAHSDPHDAISLNHLHILKSLGHKAESLFEKQVANFPQWRNCNHFNTIIHMLFSDGNKIKDISRQSFYAALSILKQSNSPEGNQLLCLIGNYLQLDSYIGLNVQTVSTTQGAACNYTTCLNEKLHGPLKEAYKRQSNGRKVAEQILCVNQNKFAVSLLRGHVDTFNEQRNRKDDEIDDLDTIAEDNLNLAVAQGHIKLGSLQQLISIQEIENMSYPIHSRFSSKVPDVRSNQIQSTDPYQIHHDKLLHSYPVHITLNTAYFLHLVYLPFWKFSTFLNTSLPGYECELRRWITLPTNFQICEYRYLKVNYKSTIDWKQATDYLWCNLSFHGQPRYDCALIQLTPERSAFFKLILMFKCHLPDIDSSFDFALVQPYTAGTGSHRRIDHELKLTHVKAIPRANSIFIPLASVICGAVLFPDHEHQDAPMHEVHKALEIAQQSYNTVRSELQALKKDY
ncbi:hypothetical protein BD769DRAFT_1741799 [Suillus cothurnatus]|nr:hypothetical protein BD769DRAFT_1741799 [Suillus cothurnatus]